MNVTLYATLRAAAGARHVEVPLPAGATVDDLVQALLARYPALRPHLLNEHGQLWPHVHVMVNGRDAPYLPDRMGTVLVADDTLDIFPPVGGG